MFRRRAPLVATLPAVLLVACGGGGGGSSLSLDDLDGTEDVCPVDLGAAAAAAGLADDGAEAEVVEVQRGSGDGDPLEDPAIDQWDGVYVDCAVAAGDGEIVTMLFAAEEERAINLLLPRIQADLEASTDDLQAVSEAFAGTGEGEVVDLGADGPGAAARIAVDGAESAVLYVSGGDGDASPGEVAEVLDHLLDEL